MSPMVDDGSVGCGGVPACCSNEVEFLSVLIADQMGKVANFESYRVCHNRYLFSFLYFFPPFPPPINSLVLEVEANSNSALQQRI